MKKCSYCAEDIQDAAIVCKHCGRDLVGPTQGTVSVIPGPPRRRDTPILPVVGIVVLVAIVGMIAIGSIGSSAPSSELPNLNVSAGRGGGGFALTNREAVPISNCRVTALDQGADEWAAAVPGSLAPSATTQIPWSAFRANDQPMPGYVGLNRSYFTISCRLGDGPESRSAGLSFN